jgi:hypothetical protein
VLAYETAVGSDHFLVTVHGPADEMARAQDILRSSSPSRMDIYEAMPV